VLGGTQKKAVIKIYIKNRTNISNTCKRFIDVDRQMGSQLAFCMADRE